MAQRIIFKVGGNFRKDLREIFKNPRKGNTGANTIYLESWEKLAEALSPQRMFLLQKMLEYADQQLDVNALAARTNRKQEAVSRDLTALGKNGLITKTRKGKNVYPKLITKEIVIQLA